MPQRHDPRNPSVLNNPQGVPAPADSFDRARVGVQDERAFGTDVGTRAAAHPDGSDRIHRHGHGFSAYSFGGVSPAR